MKLKLQEMTIYNVDIFNQTFSKIPIVDENVSLSFI